MIINDKFPLISNYIAREISNKNSCNMVSITDFSFKKHLKLASCSANIIFFIPISGEEELNKNWFFFIKKLSKRKEINGKFLYVFLFGSYDRLIDINSCIVNQINHLTKFNSLEIMYYPYKLSRFNYKITEILSFINSSDNLSRNHSNIKRIINDITYQVKDKPLKFTNECLNLTSERDGFSNIISSLNKRKSIYLNNIIENFHGKRLIVNRIDSNTILKTFKIASNNHIEILHIKSCELDETPFLSNIIRLKVINLSANKIKNIDTYFLPNGIERLNVSKNRLSSVCWKKLPLSIKELSLFNNNLKDIDGIKVLKNIEYLNIGFNPIIEVPTEIRYLKKIKHLNMAITKIKCIPEWLLKINSLETIDITDCVELVLGEKEKDMIINQGINLIC